MEHILIAVTITILAIGANIRINDAERKMMTNRRNLESVINKNKEVLEIQNKIVHVLEKAINNNADDHIRIWAAVEDLHE